MLFRIPTKTINSKTQARASFCVQPRLELDLSPCFGGLCDKLPTAPEEGGEQDYCVKLLKVISQGLL